MCLSEYRMAAAVAVSDMDRGFYEGKLGLSPATDHEPDDNRAYRCGEGSLIHVYLSPGHAGSSTATLAGWYVNDAERVVEELTGRGVTFERYEEGPIVTDEKGIATFDGGARVAYFKDSDGNTLSIAQAPRSTTVRKGEEMNGGGKGNHAEVNGLDMYYEVHGSGEPLILLHGGIGAIEMFGGVLPLLAEGRRVIAVDLQAHGRTADIDRPLSYESMADDIGALIEHLGFERSDVMGYSLGGGVALQTVIRHPEVVRKLVVVSTPFKRDGWYPEVLSGMEQMGPEAAEPMMETPMYELYASIAPKPEDWPVLLAKLGQLLRQNYDWSEGVTATEATTMIAVGYADSVRTAHAVEFFELLGGGRADGGWDGSGMSNARLAILPATTHYDIFSSPALASVVTPFLDAPMPENGRAAMPEGT